APRAGRERRRAPLFVEDLEFPGGGVRRIDREAIDFLVVAKVAGLEIADREMRQREIAEVPRILLLRGNDPHAEERQLEPVARAAAGLQMARVVPPLHRILVVRSVVTRELKLVSGQRRLELRGGRRRDAKCGEKSR